jgi:RNA polymerase sigma factor (sigma-70 family)
MTDEKAMNAVALGELNQAAVLYERYKKPLYNFFVRSGRTRDQSQDLTQQVFVRVLQYKHTFRADAVFRTWIYQIARNVHMDHLRKNSHRLSDLMTAYQVPAESYNHDQNEDIALVQKALKLLSEDYREVLILSRYQELKYEEIAELLDTTENNVKVRVHRALKQLREIYYELC